MSDMKFFWILYQGQHFTVDTSLRESRGSAILSKT